VSRHQVGRHGPERDLQVIKVRDRVVERLECVRAQEIREPLTAGYRRGDHGFKTLEPDGKETPVTGDFLVDKELCPLRFVAEGKYVVPGGLQREGLDFRDRVPRCVETADDRTHACCGDEVNGDVVPLEDTEDADLGNSPGASPAQDEGNTGAFQLPVPVQREAFGAGWVEMGPDGEPLTCGGGHRQCLHKEQQGQERDSDMSAPHRGPVGGGQ